MVVEQEVVAARQGSAEVDSAARLREVEPMVRTICRNRLGEIDGDDAAQRALLTIWRKLESDRGVDCLPSYAATCARYETLSVYRDFRRSATPAGDLSEALWADADPGPAEHAERADEIAHARDRVEALLAQLTPRQAEVMRASVLADRPTSDVAEELGIAPTSVRTAQTRAIARMRELCGTQSPNPLALNLASEERGQRAREAERARATARRVASADPLDEVRAAVQALGSGRTTTLDSGDGVTDPMGRVRAAVEALPLATSSPAAPIELARSPDAAEDSDGLTDADAAGAA